MLTDTIISAAKHPSYDSQGLLWLKRKAVAASEPEDAAMTGMTRSLERRLLALNLQAEVSSNKAGRTAVAQ